ncbi:MAG: DUF559 domain-containing protein [Saprospiraceae bacterium]|nr:DUF559 domain-containing protein [Saprospiraceae bacterium]
MKINQSNTMDATQFLWENLFKEKNFYGYEFNRDQLLFDLQVDFFCAEVNFAVLIVDPISENRSFPKAEFRKSISEKGLKLIIISRQEISQDYNQTIDYITKEFINLVGYDCR